MYLRAAAGRPMTRAGTMRLRLVGARILPYKRGAAGFCTPSAPAALKGGVFEGGVPTPTMTCEAMEAMIVEFEASENTEILLQACMHRPHTCKQNMRVHECVRTAYNHCVRTTHASVHAHRDSGHRYELARSCLVSRPEGCMRRGGVMMAGDCW